MLTMERLCERIIRLIHAPIRLYDLDGNLRHVCMDNGEQEDPLICDPELNRCLLAQCRADCPVIRLEDTDIIYGIFSGNDSIYIIGPCCLREDVSAAARRMVRVHGLDR